jgi:glycosyltransferase involved in cell wall biosynthesis
MLDRLGGGLLVEPDNVPALAAGLAELIRDTERRQQLGQAGRQAVLQQCHAGEMARQMLQALSVIGGQQ